MMTSVTYQATPRSVVEQLHSSLTAILADSPVKSRLESQGCDVVGGPPETMAARVRSDQAKWSRIIRDKNITVQ